MIRAAAAVLATTLAAQADMPSPLFCMTAETCETADACSALPTQTHFVLRQTDGEWVKQQSARGSETWVVMAASPQAAYEQAPEGARVAVVDAGVTPDGVILLHEHLLEATALSVWFARHQCRTSLADGS